MALSALALCSRALIKIGAAPITSFEEGTAEAEVAANLYSSVRDALLSAHPWSFATTQATLALLAAAPAADHAFAFRLPVDFLRAISAGAGTGQGRGLSYRIHEQALHADSEAVTLTYIFRPAEGEFPPFFDAALIARLAAEFCLPLTENSSRAELLYRFAEQDMRAARLIDSQQDAPQAISDFPLVGVRG